MASYHGAQKMSIPSSPISNDSLRTLVAFSAACSFSIDTNNPLEVVLPLFQPIATTFHGRIFDAKVLAEELSSRYDLLVSEELCEYWSRNLIQHKLIVPATDRTESGVYVWCQNNFITTPPGEFSDDLNRIVLAMRDFIGRTNDLLIQSYTDEQLISILRSGVIGSLFPKLFDSNSTHGNEGQYIFSRFLQHCASTEHEIVGLLTKLRRAAIYCDLILHLSTPKKPPNNTQIIHAYLDAPVVMDIIGLGGRRRKIFAERLLKSFNKMLFSAHINKDMIFEIQNNIRALLAKTPRERYGPTADALRSGELKIDTVKAILDRIERVVEDHGIKIDRNFDVNLSNCAMDEEQENSLLSNLQSNYSFIEAAERDVRTIRGVFSKRGDLAPSDLFSSKSIFITGNNMLANLSNKFFRDKMGYKYSNFPVVVTRSVVAALSDAIIGVETTGSMSVADMLIAAADATQYNVEVFERIEKQLREIRPDDADEVLSILSGVDYSRFVMDAVQGNPRNVTTATIQEITVKIESNFEKAANDKVKWRLDRINQRQKVIEQENFRRSNEQSFKIKLAIKELEAAHRNSSLVISELCSKDALHLKYFQKIVNALGYVVAVIAFAIVFAATFENDYLEKRTAMRFAVSVGVAVIAGFPLFGFPSIREKFFEKIKSKMDIQAKSRISNLGYSVENPLYKTMSDIKSELDLQFEMRLNAIRPERQEEDKKRALL